MFYVCVVSSSLLICSDSRTGTTVPHTRNLGTINNTIGLQAHYHCKGDYLSLAINTNNSLLWSTRTLQVLIGLANETTEVVLAYYDFTVMCSRAIPRSRNFQV